MRETAIFIDGPSGVLEALWLEHPDARGLALICHPNPEQQGTMHNKVVSTVQRTARDSGYSTLRFNYRGVGKSEGSHDMVQGEVDDAEAAVDWLLAQDRSLPLVLLGFSFGGFVAAALGGRLENRNIEVQRIFMLAPAVHRLNGDSACAGHTPLVIIQPEQDEVIDPQVVYQWADACECPHELLKVAECSHFFHGKLTDLKELLLPRL